MGCAQLLSPRCVQVRPSGRAALSEAHRLKHRTYPELSGSQDGARLVVLAAEVQWPMVGGGPVLREPVGKSQSEGVCPVS